MGTSHRRHTPCPILAGGHQQRHFFLLWFWTANFIDYSGINCLLHARIRRSIQRPLSMGPISVLRGLFGIRAFRAVSLYTRAAIWDLAFRYGYDGYPKVISVFVSLVTSICWREYIWLATIWITCCLQPMVTYFWNETNELLEMAIGALSFATIGEEYVY